MGLHKPTLCSASAKTVSLVLKASAVVNAAIVIAITSAAQATEVVNFECFIMFMRDPRLVMLRQLVRLTLRY
jgi:hypothetical protein